MSQNALEIDHKISADHKQEAENIEHPTDHYCPISLEVMTDPVVAADGFSYERSFILDYFQTYRDTHGWKYNPPPCRSPKTGAPLANMDLVPNTTLKIIIQDFKENALKAKKATDEENKRYLEAEKLKFQAASDEALRKQQLELHQYYQQQYSVLLQQALDKQREALDQDLNQQLKSVQTASQLQIEALKANNNQLVETLKVMLEKADAENLELQKTLAAASDVKATAEPTAVTHAYSNYLLSAGASISTSSASSWPQAPNTGTVDDGDVLDLLFPRPTPASAASAANEIVSSSNLAPQNDQDQKSFYSM